MSSQAAALKLFDLVQSHRVTALIHIAARLGLAELLRDGPQPLGALAAATGADEGALGRLLTALSTIGICSRSGDGELLGAIAQQNQKLCGTVFDLPRCAEAANTHLQAIGVSDRVEFVAGDFFKSVPTIADAIILKSVIHDWNDARSISILRN